MRDHRPLACRTAQYPTRQRPESAPGVRGPLVVFNRFTCGIYPLARYAGVRDRHGHPLAAGLLHLLLALAVHSLSVGPDFDDLAHLSAAAVEPPDAVGGLRVQAAGDLRAYQLRFLIVGVGAVDVI